MSHVLALAASELAALALQRNGSINHQCFRIKNLHADEIVAFTKVWAEEVSLRSSLSSVRLLVTDSLGGQVQPQFVAESDKTITYYRNNNPKGLIYIESSVQSDEQGLQNIFSLRDSNFLDSSFDGYVTEQGGVTGLLIRSAWNNVERSTPLPELLQNLLLAVCKQIHPAVETIPVRRFIQFAETAIQLWRTHVGSIDGATANHIVGEALIALGMFRDPLWNASVSRAKRRLELNLRHAELLDGGTELNAEQIEELARGTKFKDEFGVPYPPSEAERYRNLCAEYGRAPTDELRGQIAYNIFAQLFSKDTVGLKLGDKVYEEIKAASPSRLPELEALGVLVGLNARQANDAVRLSEAQPIELDSEPLKDLLTSGTRRMLERLAAPMRRPFLNPFLALAELVDSISDECDWRSVTKVKVSLKSDEVAGYSLGVFSFLFGPSLKRVSSILAGLPGACELQFDESLTDQAGLPPLIDASVDDEQSDSIASLEPLAIRVEFYDANGTLVASRENMEWDPGAEELKYFAVLWLLVRESAISSDVAIGSMKISGDEFFQRWIDRVSSREIESTASVKVQLVEDLEGYLLVKEAAEIRKDLVRRLAVKGLDTDDIDEYLDLWSSLVQKVRSELVPDGSRLPELDIFMSTDFVVLSNQSTRLLTPLHPIRLRWVSSFLKECCDLTSAVFQRNEVFAATDGSLYLEWLRNRSPRETPPIAVGEDGELLFAKSELSWWEDFSKADHSSNNLSFDGHSVDAVIDRIVSYLEAHPHKRDGLAVLILRPSHDFIPARIIEKVTSRIADPTRMAITVLAPRSRWEAIAKAAEKAPDLTGQSAKVGMFPPIDLSFIDYLQDSSIVELVGGRLFDVAVVTHILENKVVCQPITEPPQERPGRYDVLSHRPLRLTTGSIGSMALVLLPTYKDLVLEAWSTIVVRNHRMRPVSPGQPENVDLVELRVNFQDTASVFSELHACCHWVITLERHISREQLESTDAGSPDILSVENGIGENQKNTIIVSSRSGRDLICSKLRRKLRRIVGPTEVVADDQLEALSTSVYESSRHFSPRLALQALGITRATEEILGLTIARKLVEAGMTNVFEDGMYVWVSLDEYSRWFGGTSYVRADICRFRFEYVGESLTVSALVVEGKLRQAFDEHGKSQVNRTLAFLREVLRCASDQADGVVDSKMWREELARAVEEASDHAITVFSKGAVADLDKPVAVDLKVRTLADIRDGRFTVSDCRGLYSICLWDAQANEISQEESDGITVIRTYGNHVYGLLSSSNCVQATKLTITNQVGRRESRSDDLAASEVISAPSERGLSIRSRENIQEDASRLLDSDKFLTRKRMAPSELRRIYEKILGCYSLQKIEVRAAEDALAYVEGPASILFRVKPSSHIDPKKLHDKGAALKLALELEEDQNISFGIDRGFVTIDVPKSDEQRYYVDAAETWMKWERPSESLAVPIGEKQTGEIVTINFSSANSPHLLVAGTTGSGKSEALNAILFGLTRFYSPQELQLLLVDPKGTELLPFENTQYLFQKIGMDESDTIRLLQIAVEEMERRYADFRAGNSRSLAEYNKLKNPEDRLPWWLIVLDEYADLTSEPQAKKEVELHLKRLAAKARAAGIHIIIATQKPSAEVISTTLRSNLPAQLALKVRSGIESRVIMDESGAEYLNGKGDAYLRQNGALVRVQCSRVRERCSLPLS